jgi:hypothetical protein
MRTLRRHLEHSMFNHVSLIITFYIENLKKLLIPNKKRKIKKLFHSNKKTRKD